MFCNIRVCKASVQSPCSIFSWFELIWQYWRTCCFSKGRGNTETPSDLFANHNALGKRTNHNTFCSSSNPEIIESFGPGWEESYCNNVNYVKNNAIFEPLSMRACSSTPPKHNQDFVKEHNRTPLMELNQHWTDTIVFPGLHALQPNWSLNHHLTIIFLFIPLNCIDNSYSAI